MHKLLIVAIIFFVNVCCVSAQVWPKEGSVLNYRIAGFSFPEFAKRGNYEIEIAAGNFKTLDSFKKNVFKSVESKKNKVIIEVPSFGHQYTWMVTRDNKSTVLNHFSTGMNDHADTTKFHLRILHRGEQYRDCYVSVDAGGVLYDMNGCPVWYIPDTNGISGNVLDLQFTADSTITFLYRNAYEINYNGEILWKSPNTGKIGGDTVRGEFFHHEFTKLSNGNYMVLGTQFIYCKQAGTEAKPYFLVSSNIKDVQNGYRKGKFSTIIEYDKKGNVVWSWKALPYLMNSDFNYYKGPDSMLRFDPHENAFFFDEKNKYIYFGFRDLSRVIKIAYPGGNVVTSYGDDFKKGEGTAGTSLFCNQHNMGLTADGYLYFFNNNSCKFVDSLPTVVVVKEPTQANDSFKKIWEFTCTIDEGFPKNYRRIFGSGGNVKELPDHSMFINMGSEYSKLSIVNRQKETLWSALPERYMETDEKWTTIHEYRANIITRKELENIIWKSECDNP